MTREEAIELLKKPFLCCYLKCYSQSEENCGRCEQAFDMAIEVLQQEPIAEYSSDIISRKAVIDGLEHEVELYNRALDDMDIDRKERDRFEWELELVECFIEDIKELPSKGIINTKSVFNLSEDLISRQGAIDALLSYFIPQIYTGEQVKQAKKLAERIMSKVPSTQPKRPTAHWKDGRWCSNCGEGIPTYVWDGGVSKKEVHFCIRCGARMESEEE